jgi:hypothetical protein
MMVMIRCMDQGSAAASRHCWKELYLSTAELNGQTVVHMNGESTDCRFNLAVNNDRLVKASSHWRTWARTFNSHGHGHGRVRVHGHGRIFGIRRDMFVATKDQSIGNGQRTRIGIGKGRFSILLRRLSIALGDLFISRATRAMEEGSDCTVQPPEFVLAHQPYKFSLYSSTAFSAQESNCHRI